MIFVDTGAWFDSIIPTDVDYPTATRWLRQNREPLVTTDYVLDETLTLLKMRGQSGRVLAFGEAMLRGSVARRYYLSETDISDAWQVFRDYIDKEWSFTDWTSKVVMEKLGITVAFAFDHHFRQFGSITMLPPPSL